MNECKSPLKDECLYADLHHLPSSAHEDEVGSSISDGDTISESVIEDISEEALFGDAVDSKLDEAGRSFVSSCSHLSEESNLNATVVENPCPLVTECSSQQTLQAAIDDTLHEKVVAENATNLTFLLENLHIEDDANSINESSQTFLDIPEFVVTPASPCKDSEESDEVKEGSSVYSTPDPPRKKILIRLPPKSPDKSEATIFIPEFVPPSPINITVESKCLLENTVLFGSPAVCPGTQEVAKEYQANETAGFPDNENTIGINVLTSIEKGVGTVVSEPEKDNLGIFNVPNPAEPSSDNLIPVPSVAAVVDIKVSPNSSQDTAALLGSSSVYQGDQVVSGPQSSGAKVNLLYENTGEFDVLKSDKKIVETCLPKPEETSEFEVFSGREESSASKVPSKYKSVVKKLCLDTTFQALADGKNTLSNMASAMDRNDLLEDEQPPASLLPTSLPYIGQGDPARNSSLTACQIADMPSDKEDDEPKDTFFDELPAIKKGHMLDEQIHQNKSEAGPSTAFDHLKSTSFTLSEKDCFNLPNGKKRIESNLSQNSSFESNSNRSGMEFLNKANESDEKILNLRTDSDEETTKNSSNSLPINFNLDACKISERVHEENHVVQHCSRCDSLAQSEKSLKKKLEESEKALKELRLKGITESSNDGADGIKRKQGEVEKELKEKLYSAERRRVELERIIFEYESTISHYISSGTRSKEIEDLKKERDEALLHLSNVESAFNDVHAKYEKCKAAIEKFKNNEEKLLASLKESNEKVTSLTSKYQKLKEHAYEKLQEANQEFANMKRSHLAEMTAQKLIYQKLELNYRTLQSTIEQERQEKVELNNICDQLVVQLEKHNH